MHKSIADNSVPILMTSGNAQKCFDGTKTQTRRIIKERPPYLYVEPNNANGPTLHRLDPDSGLYEPAPCPYGCVGDRLWVREAWAFPGEEALMYRGNPDDVALYEKWMAGENYPKIKWTPSIHMPKWACRTVLEITEISVQQLQEITEEDAKAEGITRRDPFPDDWGRNLACSHCGQRKSQHVGTVHACFGGHGTCFNSHSFRGGFYWLWESINGAGSWAVNPWVWVIGFKKVDEHVSTNQSSF